MKMFDCIYVSGWRFVHMSSDQWWQRCRIYPHPLPPAPYPGVYQLQATVSHLTCVLGAKLQEQFMLLQLLSNLSSS